MNDHAVSQSDVFNAIRALTLCSLAEHQLGHASAIRVHTCGTSFSVGAVAAAVAARPPDAVNRVQWRSIAARI